MRKNLSFPKGLEWVWAWFRDQAEILNQFQRTSTSAEIIQALVEYIHKGDLKVEIPMAVAPAIKEMFHQRGAIGFVEMPPTRDRPFLRFMWREAQIFIYKLNEDFAEIICSSPSDAIKEEFNAIITDFIEFLRKGVDETPAD